MERTCVIVRLRVEGFHRWPSAPEEHGYLASRHRHMFHVELSMPVAHDDRDVEFVALCRVVRAWLVAQYGEPMELGSMSCEGLARILLTQFYADRVAVFEDGENGAEVRT